MDRLFLVASTFCFLFGFAYSMHALGARVYRPSRLNFFAILAGFVGQSAFLYLRGERIGRCPLTNLFEVFIFLAWAMVLFYLLIGPTYRLSLLGVFTSPLAFVLQIGALLLPALDNASTLKIAVNPWMELHAAVSIVAYGAFALGGIAGVMYLVQARMLKKHSIHGLFYQLPPIHELARAIQRLTLTGSLLLTAGLAASLPLDIPISYPKLVFAWTVWSLYLAVNVIMWRRMLSAHQTAWLAVASFIVPLISVGIVTRA